VVWQPMPHDGATQARRRRAPIGVLRSACSDRRAPTPRGRIGGTRAVVQSTWWLHMPVLPAGLVPKLFVSLHRSLKVIAHTVACSRARGHTHTHMHARERAHAHAHAHTHTRAHFGVPEHIRRCSCGGGAGGARHVLDGPVGGVCPHEAQAERLCGAAPDPGGSEGGNVRAAARECEGSKRGEGARARVRE
jgi:hypothetical protein